MSIKQRRQILAVLSVATATSALMAGCSNAPTTQSILGEKVDYRTAGAKVVSLDVPPDLSKLPGQSRYGQVSPAIVSANSMNAPTAVTVEAANTVAPGQLGQVKMERQGQMRWLSLTVPPEQVWDLVRTFWKDAGFELVVDQPESGLMETNWAENRAKLPQDIIRRTLGTVMDSLYDTGERDQFKTRIERTAKGSEIYVTHRGVSEEYANSQKDRTQWQRRAEDPILEAEILSRLMLRLGATQEAVAQVKAEVAKSTPTPTAGSTIARMTDNQSGLTVDDDFDTVWRRVGLALDRSGYTIENRDRTKGVYDVRLPGESADAPAKPGFWSRLFHSDEANRAPQKHQVRINKGNANQTYVQVTDPSGQPLTSATAQRIAKDLFNELM